MEIAFLNNIKSKLIKGEIIKSLVKLNPTLLNPAIENILDSIGLTDKDKAEVKVEIRNKLTELISGLISKG